MTLTALKTMVAGYRVVVTGATGFVAHELIKELLARGYDVHGTVRSTKDESKLAVLRKLGDALPGASRAAANADDASVMTVA